MEKVMYSFKDHLILEATVASKDMKQVLRRGLEKVMRMDAPPSDDKEGLEKYAKDRRVIDAFDLIEALEVVRKMFEQAESTFKNKVQTDRGEVDTSKGHRQGEKQFDILKDVKGAIESYFLSGKSETEGMLKKRKYRALVVLVLDPLVNMFKGMDPQQIFNQYDEVINDAIRFVKDSDIVAHPDDAFVVRRQIAQEVKRASDVKKAVDGIMKLRKKASKKKKKD